MKKFLIAAGTILTTIAFTGCGGASGEDPGESFMPDMYYARAYEAYGYNNVAGEHDSLRKRRITYNGLPVMGTVARGDVGAYHLSPDSAGRTVAKGLRNPLDSVANLPVYIKEAERLYLIQCAICHGPALDGNGPLFKGGQGPYPVAPRNLMDDYTKGLTDGDLYHAITFGKGAMGPYASQLRPEQRWWVIKYIRGKQGLNKGAAAATDTTAATNNSSSPTVNGSSMSTPVKLVDQKNNGPK